MLQSGCACRRVLRLAVSLVFFLSLGLLQPLSAPAQSSEFRAFWVDAFHAGFKNSAEVTTLINNIRKANCNAVVVEVRKRGDAYYTPDTSYADYEPHATDTSPPNFDSLADLIAKAHDTTGGKPRIEVHAWLVTWPIWGSGASVPADPQHPYNRHPEWLSQTSAGTTWNGSQYCFDPGHPGAANHTYRIAMHLVTHYDIDGINFDYVRYAGNSWGYNSTAVSRFRARFGGTGNPVDLDPRWLQFRRDQITAFLRKVYLNVLAVKPTVKVSADTITWAPGPASLADWYNTAAYKNVLQDWRAWMAEGILDLNIPMAYFDQSGAYTQDWTNWCNFTRDHQYSRHAAIGPGIYLNATADAITQIRYVRTASPAGNAVRGVCGYSYAVPDKSTTPFATFSGYLTNSPNGYDALAPGVFSQPATVPPMPWKTAPVNGHLMGAVSAGAPATILDGAVVTLSGPVSRAQTNDGSGFYGFVDLPLGDYSVRATMPGIGSATNSLTISAGTVRTSNLNIATNDITPPGISGVQVTNITDSFATILWGTDESADSVVDYGLSTSYGASVTNTTFQINRSMSLPGLSVGTTYHFRVKSSDPAGNQAVSDDFTFATNPSGVVSDLIIDNPAAAVAGTWSTGSSAVDRYGADYRYKSQGNGSSYLQFTPNILAAGNYQVFEWHSVGGNRTTDAPHRIAFNAGTATVAVNQKTLGGQWNPLGTFNFLAGSAGYVRITDAFTDAGQVVMADAIKLVYVPPLLAPLVISQPQDQAVKATSNVTFAVTATGTLPLRYQWYFNGSQIAGATTNTCTRAAVEPTWAGEYTVAITNIVGALTSSPALLTVLPLQPPVITAAPRPQAAVPGGSATFTVSASGPGPVRFQWRLNDRDLAGRVGDTLNLGNLQGGDFGDYSVRLNNDDGWVLSDPAALTLATPPALVPGLADATNLTLAFATEPGPVYAVQYVDGLEGDAWHALTNIPGTGSPALVSDAISTNQSRLYRVQIQ